jgi:hypothetical protein
MNRCLGIGKSFVVKLPGKAFLCEITLFPKSRGDHCRAKHRSKSGSSSHLQSMGRRYLFDICRWLELAHGNSLKRAGEDLQPLPLFPAV